MYLPILPFLPILWSLYMFSQDNKFFLAEVIIILQWDKYFVSSYNEEILID